MIATCRSARWTLVRSVYVEAVVDGKALRGVFARSTPALLESCVQRPRTLATGLCETADSVRSPTELPARRIVAARLERCVHSQSGVD